MGRGIKQLRVLDALSIANSIRPKAGLNTFTTSIVPKMTGPSDGEQSSKNSYPEGMAYVHDLIVRQASCSCRLSHIDFRRLHVIFSL